MGWVVAAAAPTWYAPMAANPGESYVRPPRPAGRRGAPDCRRAPRPRAEGRRETRGGVGRRLPRAAGGEGPRRAGPQPPADGRRGPVEDRRRDQARERAADQ